jgi:polysaccharide export outer membrane protein
MRFCGQLAVLVFGAVLLGGCAALPNRGPSSGDVIDSGIAVRPSSSFDNYLVVDIDSQVADMLAGEGDASLASSFARLNQQPPELRIGAGDAVTVSIWESAAGGLFSSSAITVAGSAGARSVTIPEQVVARDGSITIPYAGRVRVEGLTAPAVEQSIVAALVGRAIDPQAVVTVSRNVSNTVVITGEVVNGARVPILARGDRILDVIAQAGGVRTPVHETYISLTRRGHTTTVPMQRLFDQPSENVAVWPGDTIGVDRIQRTFTVFGATGANAEVPFDARGLSLAEAIGKAGGLVDSQANPAGVFLFRDEPVETVRRLFPSYRIPPAATTVNVAYRADLANSKMFFEMRKVQMHDKDVLYIANAPFTTIQKVLSVVQQAAAPAVTAKSLSAN